MKIYEKSLSLRTTKRIDFIEITDEVNNVVKSSGVSNGICYVFVPHTTAAVTINENADRSVVKDIISVLNKIIPEDGNYTHSEGNSDAHVKSSLVGCSIQIFVSDGKLHLGTWQGIYFCEFDGPRNRNFWIKVIGI